jgi:hypothetical protein
MKRVWFALVIVGVSATSAAAQTSLLPTLERLRQEYPTPMTPAMHGELLNRVAWQHRAEGWGLLRKNFGNRCPTPQGIEIACDILVHAPTVRHFDVLVDAGGASTPGWRDVGPCTIPPSGCEMSRFLLPSSPVNAPRNLRVVRGARNEQPPTAPIFVRRTRPVRLTVPWMIKPDDRA